MKHSESTVIVLLLLIAGLIISGLFFFFHDKNNSKEVSQNQTQLSNPTSQFLNRLTQRIPDADWSTPSAMNQSAGTYGEMQGFSTTATITTQNAMPVEFHEKDYLESLGYKLDPQLAAGGAGSTVWGYSKTENGNTDVVVFSSQTQPSNSNQNAPAEFKCPCQTTISIFVNTPAPQSQSTVNSGNNANLANPASVNCAKVGGTTSIQNGPNGQYGLCEFGDNMACEEWALYRGECPVGGIKTTGYTTKAQMYCAWVGGKTYAVDNATCTLPSGKVCSDEALYNGTCSAN